MGTLADCTRPEYIFWGKWTKISKYTCTWSKLRNRERSGREYLAWTSKLRESKPEFYLDLSKLTVPVLGLFKPIVLALTFALLFQTSASYLNCNYCTGNELHCMCRGVLKVNDTQFVYVTDMRHPFPCTCNNEFWSSAELKGNVYHNVWIIRGCWRYYSMYMYTVQKRWNYTHVNGHFDVHDYLTCVNLHWFKQRWTCTHRSEWETLLMATATLGQTSKFSVMTGITRAVLTQQKLLTGRMCTLPDWSIRGTQTLTTVCTVARAYSQRVLEWACWYLSNKQSHWNPLSTWMSCQNTQHTYWFLQCLP
jgi:hypothetical protein